MTADTSPKKFTPEDVSPRLEQLEKAAYGRETSRAVTEMLLILHLLDTAPWSYSMADNQATARALYTRLAAAMTTTVTAPDFRVTYEQFVEFCALKDTIGCIFAASSFAGPQHLQQILSFVDETGGRALLHDHVFRVCLMTPLDSLPPELLDTALEQPVDMLFPLVLAWLSQQVVLTPAGEAMRARLLASGPQWENITLPAVLTNHFLVAWMHCSYASDPDKHVVKRYLNKVLRHHLELGGGRHYESTLPTRRHLAGPDEKPVIVVVAERFKSAHAMFRCYGAAVERLRTRFRTVLLSVTNEVDEVSRAIFDETMLYEANNVPLPEIVTRLRQLQPHMIYFPSVGMAIWAIMLANLRLAPIQFMTLGHPATTNSDCMDYALIDVREPCSAACMSERVVRFHETAHLVPFPDLPETLPATRERGDGIVRIAVNSTVMKLSHRLLAILKHLKDECGKKLELHFFPAKGAIFLDGLRAMLTHQFPDAIVHPPYDYLIFLERLAECDISLAAFPFGNTNSTVDAFLVGLPVVAFTGPEPSSIGDTFVFSHLDFLPEWLLADSDEKYYQAALRLVTNDDERKALSQSIRECNARQRLFNPPPGDLPDLSEAAYWLYLNHEKILASGQRDVRAGEELPAAPVSPKEPAPRVETPSTTNDVALASLLLTEGPAVPVLNLVNDFGLPDGPRTTEAGTAPTPATTNAEDSARSRTVKKGKRGKRR